MSAAPETNVDFPWPVSSGLLKHQVYSYPTEIGKVGIVHALFACGTNIMALVVPGGGARFARLAPETEWALEERRSDVEVPECVRGLVDRTWGQLMGAMAAANKEAREAGLS